MIDSNGSHHRNVGTPESNNNTDKKDIKRRKGCFFDLTEYEVELFAYKFSKGTAFAINDLFKKNIFLTEKQKTKLQQELEFIAFTAEHIKGQKKFLSALDQYVTMTNLIKSVDQIIDEENGYTRTDRQNIDFNQKNHPLYRFIKKVFERGGRG